jgi:hypothetical protein
MEERGKNLAEMIKKNIIWKICTQTEGGKYSVW